LLRLCETADVFLTNWLPAARRAVRIDVEDIRAANPKIIYVRGHGQGIKGPDAEQGGFDSTSFYARSGVADAYTQGEDPYGPRQTPAFGDQAGGQTIAGGIAAALFRRERTGEPSVIDVSLLAQGVWMMAPLIIASKLFDVNRVSFPYTRADAPNPLGTTYLTHDRRVVHLGMLQVQRHWAEFCETVGRPDLAADPRFATYEGIVENRIEAIKIFEEVFAARTLAEWREVLKDLEVPWSPYQTVREVHDDRQVIANEYIKEVNTGPDREPFSLVPSPVQFDETVAELYPAPEPGQHTDEILLELGLDWDEIVALKVNGAIL
jgi:crotonobetainyl-CoA:carnitine CoA-transferase CaiB-like acyl-CoA transferase